MHLRHVRHATSILTLNHRSILVDPVLAEAGTLPPIPLTPCKRPNPMTGLKTPLETLLGAQAILSTHLHRDHFDQRARELLDRGRTVLCQPGDAPAFRDWGFRDVRPVEEALLWEGITVTRVAARHGEGPVGEAMGTASGYVLGAPGEPTVYLAGDTMDVPGIRAVVETHHPSVRVLNAGAPRFLHSRRIVLDLLDLERTLRDHPDLPTVLVHLDTWNHCIETREDYREYFTPQRLRDLGVQSLLIPEDDEVLRF